MFSMVAVITVLFVAVMKGEKESYSFSFIAPSNVMALYSMVAFALSAVMSVPQVVKAARRMDREICD